MNYEMHTIIVVNAQSVAVGTPYTSQAIDLSQVRPHGYFGLQTTLASAGAGTADISYEVSINGSDFMLPSQGSLIEDDFTKTSGPGSDGKDISTFTPETARWLRIKVTASTATVVVTCTLCIQ